MTIVGIHQPNFFPWLGYFNKIANSDKFIFLDDVGFTKGGLINRSKILVQGKEQWMTLTLIKPKLNMPINEVELFNEEINKNKILKTLEMSYSKTEYYNGVMDFIDKLVLYKTSSLSDYNINNIRSLCTLLEINTEFYLSSDLKSEKKSSELVIDLVQKLNGKIYLSGQGARKYQTDEEFLEKNLILEYQQYSPLEYKQLNTDIFYPGLSILDSLFNNGIEKTRELIIN